MILIACVDDNLGMLFNNRRQSMDRVLRARLLKFCGAHNLAGHDVVKASEKEMQKIILYRWNRVYPADLYFDIDLKNWHLKESNDFAGSSHDKITEEIYVK